MSAPLLQIRDLEVRVRSGRRDLIVVDGISLAVGRGSVLGLVGESGCGKSMTLRAIIGLLPAQAQVTGGQILFGGQDLAQASPRVLEQTRGQAIAMIFQEPMTALNPVMRVGDQIGEGAREEHRWSRKEARDYAANLMRQVGIPEPEQRLRAYPHELSGGLRQRVMIAIALARKPLLILCDEPTTALDVTVQEQVLRLLLRLRDQTGATLLLVTHDLAVVAETCHEVAVMYAGRIVETGMVDEVFSSPMHPYTVGLLRSVPDVGDAHHALESIPGKPPEFDAPPPGCRFHPRCSLHDEACMRDGIVLRTVALGRATACIHYERLEAASELAGR